MPEVSNLLESPLYPHHVIFTFDDAQTCICSLEQGGQVQPWQTYAWAEDLLRDHPITPVKRLEWKEGGQHFLIIGTEEVNSIKAHAFHCGLHPTQIRLALLFLQTESMANIHEARILQRQAQMQAAQRQAAQQAQHQDVMSKLALPTGFKLGKG